MGEGGALREEMRKRGRLGRAAGQGGGAAQLWPAGTLGVDVATLQTRSC